MQAVFSLFPTCRGFGKGGKGGFGDRELGEFCELGMWVGTGGMIWKAGKQEGGKGKREKGNERGETMKDRKGMKGEDGGDGGVGASDAIIT